MTLIGKIPSPSASFIEVSSSLFSVWTLFPVAYWRGRWFYLIKRLEGRIIISFLLGDNSRPFRPSLKRTESYTIQLILYQGDIILHLVNIVYACSLSTSTLTLLQKTSKTMSMISIVHWSLNFLELSISSFQMTFTSTALQSPIPTIPFISVSSLEIHPLRSHKNIDSFLLPKPLLLYSWHTPACIHHSTSFMSLIQQSFVMYKFDLSHIPVFRSVLIQYMFCGIFVTIHALANLTCTSLFSSNLSGKTTLLGRS